LLRATAVELGGDAPVAGVVARVVAVQKVKAYSSDLCLPGAQIGDPPRQLELDAKPFSGAVAYRDDRKP